MAKPAPVFDPIPPPGLFVFPNYIANKTASLTMRSGRKRKDLTDKVKKISKTRVVSSLDPSGNAGDDLIFLEGTKGQIEFRDANSNQVLYSLVKENHEFRPDKFFARDAYGKELFMMKIKEHIFGHDEYSKST